MYFIYNQIREKDIIEKDFDMIVTMAEKCNKELIKEDIARRKRRTRNNSNRSQNRPQQNDVRGIRVNDKNLENASTATNPGNIRKLTAKEIKSGIRLNKEGQPTLYKPPPQNYVRGKRVNNPLSARPSLFTQFSRNQQRQNSDNNNNNSNTVQLDINSNSNNNNLNNNQPQYINFGGELQGLRGNINNVHCINIGEYTRQYEELGMPIIEYTKQNIFNQVLNPTLFPEMTYTWILRVESKTEIPVNTNNTLNNSRVSKVNPNVDYTITMKLHYINPGEIEDCSHECLMMQDLDDTKKNRCLIIGGEMKIFGEGTPEVHITDESSKMSLFNTELKNEFRGKRKR